MDNAASSPRAGALQLSETLGIEALHACIKMAYRKRISKAHILRQFCSPA